ncbi:hypothetical protein PRIC2_014766 [Phytophthora ramorum]
MQALATLSLLLPTAATIAQATMEAVEVYSGSNCAGTPGVVAMTSNDDCTYSTCNSTNFGNDTFYLSTVCTSSSTFDFAAVAFTEFNFVVVEYYQRGAECAAANLTETDAFPASGSCQIASSVGTSSVIASLYSNGSLTVSYYSNDACGGDSFYVFALDSANVSSGDCIDGAYKVYSSDSPNGIVGSSSTSVSSSQATGSSSGSGLDTESASSSLSTGGVIGIIVAAVVAVVLLAIMLLWYRRRAKKDKGSFPFAGGNNREEDAYAGVVSPTTGHKSSVSGTTVNDSNSLGLGPKSLAGLWDDEIIATARIPREKVLVQH